MESVNLPVTGLLAEAGTARDGRLARGPTWSGARRFKPGPPGALGGPFSLPCNTTIV